MQNTYFNYVILIYRTNIQAAVHLYVITKLRQFSQYMFQNGYRIPLRNILFTNK